METLPFDVIRVTDERVTFTSLPGHPGQIVKWLTNRTGEPPVFVVPCDGSGKGLSAQTILSPNFASLNHSGAATWLSIDADVGSYRSAADTGKERNCMNDSTVSHPRRKEHLFRSYADRRNSRQLHPHTMNPFFFRQLI
ncbi:MAG: hypothetical protein JW863_11560 [Chitinispirillaceae bacterium]|nr:hypothetical protein [Chitinispirillaceae bacterium]